MRISDEIEVVTIAIDKTTILEVRRSSLTTLVFR